MRGKFDVVIAYHTHLVRDAEPFFMYGVEDADGGIVVARRKSDGIIRYFQMLLGLQVGVCYGVVLRKQ